MHRLLDSPMHRLLDWLLGPRCHCGQRVFPRDLEQHAYLEHAGDRVDGGV